MARAGKHRFQRWTRCGHVVEAARYNVAREVVNSFESLLLIAIATGKSCFLSYNGISYESERAKLLIPRVGSGPAARKAALIRVQMQSADFPPAQVAA
jgi:hypothetical protein